MIEQENKRLALVTGGNSGIGLETCRGLLEANFHVILAARSQSKADTAIADLLATAPAGSTAEPLILDLASLDSVRRAADSFLESERTLSVCVLNAGIMALPWQRTEDGFEQQWQVNVLGHFSLCRALLPTMNDRTGRVVHLSSRAHRRHPEPIDYKHLSQEHLSDQNYDRWLAYGRSKLANILFSNELARRLDERGIAITSNAVHPGLVATNLLTNAGGSLGRGVPVAEGARTSIYVATSSELAGKSGGYYVRSAPVDADGDRTEVSLSEEEGKRFWRAACEDLNLSQEL